MGGAARAARLGTSVPLDAVKSAAASSFFFVESLGLFFGAAAVLRTAAPKAFARVKGLGRAACSAAARRPGR